MNFLDVLITKDLHSDVLKGFEIKKILVPMDGSQISFGGLDKAIYFAQKCQAEITGLCVAFVPPNLSFVAVENMDNAARSDINELLEKAKTICGMHGVNFHGEIELGQPGPKILEYANRWNFDLIVIGSRGAGSTDESFIGSVANYLIQKTKIPVIVVK